jgi:hypothetical protein
MEMPDMEEYEMREELISNEPPPYSFQETSFIDDNVNYDVGENLNDSVVLGPAPRMSTLTGEDMVNTAAQDVLRQRTRGTPFSDLSDNALNILSARVYQDGNDLYLKNSIGNKMRLTGKRAPYKFLTKSTMVSEFLKTFGENQTKENQKLVANRQMS